MMTRGGEGGKKCRKFDDVICERPLINLLYVLNLIFNKLENSKYGQKTGKKSPNFENSRRLQMVSKIRDFWQGDRKRSNLGSCI